jgi:hypothetical protein
VRTQDEVVADQLQGKVGEPKWLGAPHDVKAVAKASERKLFMIGGDDIEAFAHQLEGNNQTRRDVSSDEVVGRAGINKCQELLSVEGLAPVRPTACTGQTGQTLAARDEHPAAGQLPQIQIPISRSAPRIQTRLWG